MPSIDMLRRFAGADPEGDAQVLGMCLKAAVQWYEKAGVPETQSDLYDFWVCNLASWFYDNRGGDNTAIPPYIVASVHQLRPKKVKS